MFRLGDYLRSRGYYEQNISLLNSLGSSRQSYPQVKRISLSGLGTVYSALGVYPKAIYLYNESLNILPQNRDANLLDNPRIRAFIQRSLGIAYLNQGEIEQSQEKFNKSVFYQRESLEITRSIRDRKGEGRTLGGLGHAYYVQGNYDEAIVYANEYLKVARETQDRRSEGQALGILGWAHYGKKNFQEAVKFQKESLEIARQIKDRALEGQALSNLGDALLQKGSIEDAQKILFNAVEVSILRTKFEQVLSVKPWFGRRQDLIYQSQE